MSLSRKFLKEILAEYENRDEIIELIIEAHTETVDGLKTDIAKYKGDAEKLSDVQKELNDLKAAGDGGYKEKYETEKAAFEKYKGEQIAKETNAAKEKAVRAYFASKNITGKNLEIAMRGSRAEIEALNLDGNKIKDVTALDALVAGDFAGLVYTTTITGANPANPPFARPQEVDLGNLSMEEYIAVRSGRH